jgi:hypothetical protein
MAISMLEYSKLILEQVGFDATLFRKELHKALKRLISHDQEELLCWCVARYSYP